MWWVHAAFVGTIIGLGILLTVAEILNLWHTKQCVEDGYDGLRSFDDETDRYEYLVAEATGRTLYRVLLAAFVFGMVYLGPLDWLVARLGEQSSFGLLVAAGVVLLAGEMCIEEVGALVRLWTAFGDAGSKAVLSYWVRQRLADALRDLAVSASIVVVLAVIVLRWPDRWPIYVLLVFAVGSVLIDLLMPLYLRLRWREESEVVPRSEVSAVLKGFDVRPAIVDVESTNEDIVESSQFGGLGPSKTVFIREHDGTDTEFRATLAHELGHAEHRHIEKLILYQVVTVGIDLLIVWSLLDSAWFYTAFGIPQGTTIPALLVALIWVAAVHRLVFSTAENALSHRFEFVADDYAFEEAYRGVWEHSLRDHIDATLLNPYQHPLFSLCNTVHPPVVRRIDREREHD